MNVLETRNLTLSYDEHTIIDNLQLQIPKGEITVLVGSNGSGKSTVLRSLARLLSPSKGTVLLDGKDISKLGTKEIAKRMAILPQSPTAPQDMTVRELVKQGRYPHQGWFRPWTAQDECIVDAALAAARLTDIADRPVDALSGGQRQRAWIAMTLAQDTETILLDEPTTYLDLAHQIEVLDLLQELNELESRTIVMVLHDINLACRYAHRIVAVHGGKVYASGEPSDVVTTGMMRDVFGLECHIARDPLYGTPLVVPVGKGLRVMRKGPSHVTA